METGIPRLIFKRLFSKGSTHPYTGSYLGLRMWDFLGTAILNMFAFLLVVCFLFPMSYMLVTSFKDESQFLIVGAPIWPAAVQTYSYQGSEYDVYLVPTDEGEKHWALIKPGRTESAFIDVENPQAGPILWQGQWRRLERAFDYSPDTGNFSRIWRQNKFPRLIQNTLFIAFVSEIGVLISSIAVAYGFSRFPLPGGKWLFALLIGSIMIPEKVTLIPTYALYLRLGWIGSYLPLIAPLFFGNAIFIFLLRQNFKSIPKDMDEAAMLDGASPFRILISIILPQSYPVVVTVALLHFFYIWNETRLASLYLGTKPQLQTIAFGIQNNQTVYPTPNLLQASTLLVMAVPVIVLFLSQRIFMQKVMVTGMEK